jgi:Resolvase, N terminal domain
MARADLAQTGSIRCAIYTRKSSDEGLAQEFNSLDAQREACEAYIVSQRHAGWVALADMYDDGGLSGGTMERPALKRLQDIEAGKVQIIVVYKVDRLTRSLADFAKIVDVLDAHTASFVSVTQQFNTTTLYGASDAQHAALVRPIRARDRGRAPGQRGRLMRHPLCFRLWVRDHHGNAGHIAGQRHPLCDCCICRNNRPQRCSFLEELK